MLRLEQQLTAVRARPLRAREERMHRVAQGRVRGIGDVPVRVVLERIAPELFEDLAGDRPPRDLIAALAEEIPTAGRKLRGKPIGLLVALQLAGPFDP